MEFPHYEGEVLPQWIDANGHMNLAYDVVLFDQAIDALARSDRRRRGISRRNRVFDLHRRDAHAL